MDKEKALEYLQNQKWIWAKTYSSFAPHWYILSHRVGNPDIFIEVANYIKNKGVEEYFYSIKCNYIYDNEYKYWVTKGSGGITIINKSRIEWSKKVGNKYVSIKDPKYREK